MTPSALLLGWYRQTLERLAPGRLLRAAVADLPLDVRSRRPQLVIALGKAAAPLLEAWIEIALGPLDAYIALPAQSNPATDAPWTARPGLACHRFAAGHPEPNAASLAAAEAMLAAARRLAAPSVEAPAPTRLVALVSGGGSALAEAPLPGAGLADTVALYRALVRSGAPIGAVNTLRKHLSRFKGGQLAAAAAAPQVEQLTFILSDVAGPDWMSVASGPTAPDPSTAAECAALWQAWMPAAPPPRFIETPKPGDPAFARSRFQLLADNARACATLADLARAAGFDPVIDAAADEWECRAAADYLVARWRGLRRERPRPCLIAGGEARVRIDIPAPGQGGRNQALALLVAERLEGESFHFLSAGTDGIDGDSPAAGALVDGTTVARARRAGFDPARHLAGFDAYPLLAAIGDTVVTGPTGNNLRDLRVFI